MIQINTKESFSLKIENFIIKNKTDIMDAILHICEEEGIEHETVGKLLTNSLKEELQAELEERRLLKKEFKRFQDL